ncbi:hypothetical protein Tco_0553337 [Tanacetum coccineum]
MSSSHSTVAYTSESGIDGSPWGIHLMLGSDSEGFEAAPQSPEHAPLSPAYAPDTCFTRSLSPDYSADSEPIEDDPQEDPEEEPFEEEEEELPAPATSTPAIADLASQSEETEPFEEDEVAPTPPSPISSHSIIPLSQTRLRRARKSVRPHTPLQPSIDTHIEAWLAAPTPPSPSPSPLSPLSSPLPRIPSPPLPSSPTHRDSIPKADLPPQKRARLSSSSPRFKIRKSSAAAIARQPGAVLRARMASLEQEARYLRTSVITVKHEAAYARDALSFAMDRIRELQMQRQDDGDRVIRVIGRVRELERQDKPPDTGSNYEANQNSGNGNDDGNGSHDSGSGGGRTSHTARVCTYKEFLNCTDIESYTQRFQELVLLCSRMVPDKTDKVERYVGGLPDSIHGSVMASKPKILQEAIELARSLMDQKVLVYVARQADNKKRMDNNPRNNHAQQPLYKRQNVARAYTVGPGEKRE